MPNPRLLAAARALPAALGAQALRVPAVEVYARPSEAPPFANRLSQRGDANGGAVLFWTVSAR